MIELFDGAFGGYFWRVDRRRVGVVGSSNNLLFGRVRRRRLLMLSSGRQSRRVGVETLNWMVVIGLFGQAQHLRERSINLQQILSTRVLFAQTRLGRRARH